MDCKNRHQQHDHVHDANCGHTTIRRGNDIAYLHDGHMHAGHGDHYDCVAVEVSSRNPDSCTPEHACDQHDRRHSHGANCGHERVPHGDHVDYLVGNHLHHAHGSHCDDHGQIEVERSSKAA